MKSYVNYQPFMRRVMALLFGVTLFGIPMITASASDLRVRDDSAAWGIAKMCASLLEGTSRRPDATDLLRGIYRAGVQDIQALKKLGKPADVADAIGVIQAAPIDATGINPNGAELLEEEAKQCLADLEELKQKKGHGLF